MTVSGLSAALPLICNPLHPSPTPAHQEACHLTGDATNPPAHARHPPLSVQQRARPLNSTEDPQDRPSSYFAFPRSSPSFPQSFPCSLSLDQPVLATASSTVVRGSSGDEARL